MAVLGKWSGGTTTLIPSASWQAPNGLFPTEDRNDSSTYSFNSSTSTLTLPSSNLADGYLLVGAFEFEDTSNGRHNPQGKFEQQTGTGNFVCGRTGGFNRDTSEDRAYVRCWAVIDNPSASATIAFEWQRDADAPTGGTVRSELQVIPLYYDAIAMYDGTSASLYGGTTPNQVTGWATVHESDTNAISMTSNVVTMKTDNKYYLALGGQHFVGLGTARTQRWHGFRIDGTKDDSAKAYSYYRNASNNESGDMFTTIVERNTTDVTIDQFCYRGDGVASGQGGADIDSTAATGANHAFVVIELQNGIELWKNTGSTNQNIATTGPVDIQVCKTGDLTINEGSFIRADDETMLAYGNADLLLGANISAASQAVSSGSRFTGYAEFTKDGIEDADSFAGDYLRGNQGTQDTFGWSANLLGYMEVVDGTNIGVSATELSGSEGGGGAVHIQSGWAGFWGINLDSMSAPVDHAFVSDDVESVSQVSGPTVSQSFVFGSNDVEAASEVNAPTVDQTTSVVFESDNLESASEVSNPTLSTSFALTSDDLESASEVNDPVLGFSPDLESNEVDSQSYVSSPTVQQRFAFGSDNLESASEVSSPETGQTYSFGSDDLEAGSEVSSPNLGFSPDLASNEVESASEVASPAFGQRFVFSTDDLQSGSEVSSPDVEQSFSFGSDNIESSSEVNSPAVTQGAAAFTSDNLESAGEVNSPELGFSPDLASNEVESGSEVSSPNVGQVFSFVSDNLESVSEVNSPGELPDTSQQQGGGSSGSSDYDHWSTKTLADQYALSQKLDRERREAKEKLEAKPRTRKVRRQIAKIERLHNEAQGLLQQLDTIPAPMARMAEMPTYTISDTELFMTKMIDLAAEQYEEELQLLLLTAA